MASEPSFASLRRTGEEGLEAGAANRRRSRKLAGLERAPKALVGGAEKRLRRFSHTKNGAPRRF